MEVSSRYDIYSDNNLKFKASQPVPYAPQLLPGTSWWPESWSTLTDGADYFFGDSRNNWVNGVDGNDVLFGRAGNDILSGGRGADYLSGGAGDDLILQDANDSSEDRIYGGTGVDTLDYSVASLPLTGHAAGTKGIEADLSTGRIAKSSGAYDTVSGIENVLGTSLDDRIVGSAENNTLSSGAGNDTLYGGRGNDRLYGGDGSDTLYGGAGSDWLIGGAGNDSLSGEAGDDLYELTRGSGQDKIRDYDATANNHDALVIGVSSRIGNTTALSNDVSAQQVWLRHVGNDLEISVIGTSDKVTVQDWYSGSYQNRLEAIQLGNGRTLGGINPDRSSVSASVEKLVQAMAAFVPPAAGQISLPANYATKLVPLIEANWSPASQLGSRNT